MKDVNHKYYIVAIVDEEDPDDYLYVGVDPLAVGTLSTAVYLTADIEDAEKVSDAATALRLAEAADEMFSHFGRPYIASTAVSIKWTAV